VHDSTSKRSDLRPSATARIAVLLLPLFLILSPACCAPRPARVHPSRTLQAPPVPSAEPKAPGGDDDWVCFDRNNALELVAYLERVGVWMADAFETHGIRE